MAVEVIWRPQAGPQKALIDCPLPEIFYGGARGGGKTDGVLGKYAIKAELYGQHFNAIFFRRELPMLDDAIERSRELYTPLGATYNEQKKAWKFANGGRIRFRPLERVTDAEKYQGQNVTDACIEEAGNFPDPRPIDRINGVLRSAAGVPTQLILTGNPGGPGQLWIADRYINPWPAGMRVLTRKLANGQDHRFVYIPSRLTNNRILLANDPGYVNRLHLVGSPQLVKAWLDGDWTAIEGAFFPEFGTAKHVIDPVTLPAHWTRFRAIDWGSARPFSVGWYAVSDGELPGIARGCLVKYREWYGSTGEPNVGLKLTAEEVADGIKERTAEKISYTVIDPAAFAEDGGPSIGERMGNRGVHCWRADNARVARNGALGGWDQLRARLKGDGEQPQLLLFSTCKDTIRTLPALQHDDLRPEDVDTDAEDHAADETRYACMSRPYQQPAKAATTPKFDYEASGPNRMVGNLSIREIVKRHERRMRSL